MFVERKGKQHRNTEEGRRGIDTYGK